MKKSTKIFIYFFVLATLALAVFVGIIVRNRYYKETSTENISTETANSENRKNEDAPLNNITSTPTDIPGEFLNTEDKNEDANEEATLKEDTTETSAEKESYLEIKKSDCENKCADFKNEKADFRYCQEVCGLVEVTKESSSEECEDLEDLEMDYCLRDLAISKKDYKLCEKIEDKNISLNCQNRITENILEEQKK